MGKEIISKKTKIYGLILLFVAASLIPITITGKAYETKLFYPTDDASTANPNEPFMEVRNDGTGGFEWVALVKFSTSSLPSNAEIQSATLNLYYWNWRDNNPAGRSLNLYRVITDWNEETVEWNNQPSYATQPTSAATIPTSTGVWMHWDVTNDIQSFVDGTKTNYGWKVTDENYWGQGNIPISSFRAKEYGNYIPYLNVVYTVNSPPTAEAGGPYQARINTLITFNGAGSYDPDGTITGYRWDFTNDGTYDTGWLTSPTTTHSYPNPGKYTIKLQIKDNDQATDDDTATATISANTPPTAEAGGPYQGNTDVSIVFDGSGSSDADGTITTYLWNFGDGSTGTGVSPSHAYTTAGIYTVTLTVTDNDGITDIDTTTATINVSKTPRLVLTVSASNIEVYEENNEKTITLTVYCYDNSVNNVHVEVLTESNLTITQLSPNLNLRPGEQADLVVNVKTPKVKEGVKWMNETISLKVVGDNGIISNVEQINFKVIPKNIPGFETVATVAAAGIAGALVTFFRRRNGNR